MKNLDEYSKVYGWDKVIPSTIARQNQFTTDFKTIGSGSLFSTPVARVSLIGMYFNTEKLTKLGIAPPTTLAEFEAAAAKAKAAGEIPIAYGSQDSPTAVLLALQALYADANTINNFTYGDTAVTADQAGLTKAAETVKKWNDAGWFTPHHEGIDYQTAVANYLDGKGVFRFEYTGSLGLTDAQQGKFGYIQLPQASGSGTVGVGAAPSAMVIATKCKHPDVAAAFLDFLMSKDAAQASADKGLIPLLHDDATIADNMATLKQESAGRGGDRCVRRLRPVLRLDQPDHAGHPEPADAVALRRQGNTCRPGRCRGQGSQGLPCGVRQVSGGPALMSLVATRTAPARGGAGHPGRPARRRGPRSRNRHVGLAFVALPLLFYTGVVLVPLGQSFQYSFYNWDGVSKATWVGFDNYLTFFTDPVLSSTLGHVLVLIFFFAIMPIVLGLLVTAADHAAEAARHGCLPLRVLPAAGAHQRRRRARLQAHLRARGCPEHPAAHRRTRRPHPQLAR